MCFKKVFHERGDKNNSIKGINLVPIAKPFHHVLNLSLNSKLLFSKASSARSVREVVDAYLFCGLCCEFLLKHHSFSLIIFWYSSAALVVNKITSSGSSVGFFKKIFLRSFLRKCSGESLENTEMFFAENLELEIHCYMENYMT